MSKFSGRSRSGSTSASVGRAVTIAIDAQVRRSYARKAVIAFWVTAVITAVLAAVVVSANHHPLVGLVAGAFIGAVVGGVVAALVFCWPVLRVFWHWATEIVTAAGLLYAWTVVMESPALVATLLSVVAVVLVSTGLGWLLRRCGWSKRPGWGWLRAVEVLAAVLSALGRGVVALVWCLLVRHRLRVCFTAFIHAAGSNHAGNPPLVLWARPTPAGERVWVWLRPGLALSDLEGRTDKMAVACWATDVRVLRGQSSYAALVQVDVTRRDPLRATVFSPLARMVPADDPTPTSPGMPPLLDLDLSPDDFTNDVPAEQPKRGRAPRQPKADKPGPSDADEYDAFI